MDDDQAPCIPCLLFHPVACRAKLVGVGGSRKVAEELVAAMGAASGLSLTIGHPWLLRGGCNHWPYPSRNPGTYCTCPVSEITPVATTFLLCWEWITKLTGSLGTFFQALSGPVTQVAASALLLCLHWLPSLGIAGEWGVGADRWLCNQWVIKTTSADKGLVLGVWACYVTLETASCSQELKPRGFLSAKLLSCTSWDTQGPAPRLPQPVSYSVSWGLHPPSSCADSASSLITKHRGANQPVQNPVTLCQSPVCWTLGGPAGPHSTIPGAPMDAPPGARGVMGCRS